MTPRLQACLKAIEDLTVDGVSPTYQQIADHLGISSKGRICRMIDDLVSRGRVIRVPHRQRCLRIAGGDGEAVPFDEMAEAILTLSRGAKALNHHAIRQALTDAYARAA